LVIVMSAGLLAAAMVTVIRADGTTGPKVNASAVVGRVSTPPPAEATTTRTIGRNHVAISRNHDDSAWIEQIDIDGDGTVDEAHLVWDEPDKILFASKSGAFMCKNGESGKGDMLIAINAGGNSRRRLAGSGFWVADVEEGECGAEVAGVFGCRFDADGNDTRCGLVHIDQKTDDILIITPAK
jgi:hypothetical protein